MWNKVKKVYIWDKQVRPALPKCLCFTANTANSTLYLKKNGSPATVTLETSTDWKNWNTYTIGSSMGTITLANVWDKVYFRNTSETDTWFSTSATNSYFYQFVMTGSISASWDVFYLLNKNSTKTASNACFTRLFYNCTSLTTAPKLPATTLGTYSYNQMFSGCSNLTTVPELPATTVPAYCYQSMFQNCTSLTTAPQLPATTLDAQSYRDMFNWCSNLEVLPLIRATSIPNYWCYQMFRSCSKIKISATQTWEYQTPYRIPNEWTWTVATRWLMYMFNSTGWTYTSDPAINTTYYTSNTVV